MASKNIFSEGYIHFEEGGGTVSVTGEIGEGVVVTGEISARGIELVTRSEANGLCFVSWGAGEGVDAEIVKGGEVRLGGGCGVFRAASSHAARADGSTGQVDGGLSFEGA